MEILETEIIRQKFLQYNDGSIYRIHQKNMLDVCRNPYYKQEKNPLTTSLQCWQQNRKYTTRQIY